MTRHHRPRRSAAPAALTRDLGRPWPRLVLESLLLLALVAAALLNGCAGSAHARGGTRLSDAVETAARSSEDRDEKDRDRDRDHERDHDRGGRDRDRDERPVLRVAPKIPRVTVHRHGHSCSGYGDDDCDGGSDPRPTLFAGASFDGLARHDEAIDGGGQVTLRFGGFAPGTRERFALEGELAVGHLDAAPRLSDGINDLYEFTAGAAVRAYASPSHVGAGLYGTAGVRGGVLRWDYASPLLVDDGYDIYDVTEDGIVTWSPFIGAGVTLFRDQPVQLDVAVLRGLQFYGDRTNEGFRNDLFDTDGFTQVRVGLIGVFR